MPASKIKAPYTSKKEALGKSVRAFRKTVHNATDGPQRGVIKALDLFAGAGGYSSGLLRAAREHGFEVDLTILNHWHQAIETARRNLGAIKVFNCSITDADPKEVVPGGYLDVMLASPECVHFSSARGSKPINDQRRSSCAEVLRFLSEIDVQCLLLENVKELSTWGPLDSEHRPIKERKGEFFDAFIKAIKRLGYNVSYGNFVAADYGDPTTRSRLYLIAHKGRAVSFPAQTHSKGGKVPGTLPWIPARKIINFKIRGESIFHRRDPHAVKTVRRMKIGFSDQVKRAPLAAAYVTSLEIFKAAAETYHEAMEHKPTESKLGRKLTKDERAQTRMINDRARREHRLIVEELFREPVAIMTWEDLLLHEMPEPTISSESMASAADGVDPFLCKLYGTATTVPVSEPLDTVTAGGGKYTLTSPVSRAAAGQASVDISTIGSDTDGNPVLHQMQQRSSGLAEAFMVTVNHGTSDDPSQRHTSLDAPANVVTSRGADGLVTPAAIAVDGFVLRANASDTSSWDDATTPLSSPLRAIVTKNNLGVVEAESIILSQQAYNRSRSTDEPVATATTRGAGYLATPEAIIVARNEQHHDDENRTQTLDETLRTCTTRGIGYLAEPTATPASASAQLPEAFIASYYGPKDNRDRAPRGLDQPLATAPTANRFSLVEGVIIPQQCFAEDTPFDGLDRPLRSIQTQNGTAFAEPEAFITPNFGERETQKPRTHSLDEPMPTAIGHGAGMLVSSTAIGSVTPGKPYVIVSGVVIELDILYRMLTVDELARAMSFTDDEYTYELTGSTSDQTRQIGNAVAVRTAKALINHALRHRFEAECKTGVAA